MTKVNDSPKNRGAMIGGAVTALLVAGGFAAIAISGQGGERGARNENAPPLILAQVGDPGGTPVAPQTAPTTPAVSQSDKDALKGTSFGHMPDSYAAAAGTGGGGGFGGGGFGSYGAPGGGFGGGAAASTGPATPTNWKDPLLAKHISRKKTAPNARPDPFVSYRFPGVQKLPAYLFMIHNRLAVIPEPPKPPPSTDPDLQFGPLPVVPRRVAGILYNGSVSAILEIGPPGASAEIYIVRPGDKVPSSIAGIGELTVTSISPTQLILRADDGRTVTVALSGAPELQGQTITTGGGGFPGGGAPGGGFRPGGAPGGGGGGAGKPQD